MLNLLYAKSFISLYLRMSLRNEEKSPIFNQTRYYIEYNIKKNILSGELSLLRLKEVSFLGPVANF